MMSADDADMRLQQQQQQRRRRAVMLQLVGGVQTAASLYLASLGRLFVNA